MGKNLSHEEVRQNYRDNMPGGLSELFYYLDQEVCRIHEDYSEYDLLLGPWADQTLLSNTAGEFFARLSQIYFNHLLLHIRRLTDPPQSCGKDNLSVTQLLEHADDYALLEKLEPLVEVALHKAVFAKDWRNQYLAHQELPPLDGSERIPLAVCINDIETALSAIANVLNCVSRHYLDSETAYKHVINPPNGAGRLKAVLEMGIEYEKQEREQLLGPG